MRVQQLLVLFDGFLELLDISMLFVAPLLGPRKRFLQTFDFLLADLLMGFVFEALLVQEGLELLGPSTLLLSVSLKVCVLIFERPVNLSQINNFCV